MTGDLNTPEVKGELYAAWDHAFLWIFIDI
jgi:hypothetical protein